MQTGQILSFIDINIHIKKRLLLAQTSFTEHFRQMTKQSQQEISQRNGAIKLLITLNMWSTCCTKEVQSRLRRR